MSKINLELPQKRTFETVITIIDNDNNYYELKDGEKLIFAVKLNAQNSEYIIRKELTAQDKYGNGYLLTLTAEDMNIPCEHYHYDAALQSADETEIVSIINYSDFIVTESVVK